MIAKFWIFMRKPANLALLIALGGGAAWLWREIKPITPPASKNVTASKAPPAAQNAEADNGSNAVNARDNASVTIGK